MKDDFKDLALSGCLLGAAVASAIALKLGVLAMAVYVVAPVLRALGIL